MSDKLEQELKKALLRVEPPRGFAERVLARARKERERSAQRSPWLLWPRTGGLRWAMTCALCAALTASGLVYHHEREKRGEQAKEQLMLALRITSSKLQIAAQGMQEMNSPEPHQQ
jgi:hypothetical protein